ncbi:hypothetical protein AZ46_0218135 [Metabacillus indicus LMG 22858]|nr:hypothetical protein AZ46_0218135 [Metabacillus indicus LMG 22858]
MDKGNVFLQKENGEVTVFPTTNTTWEHPIHYKKDLFINEKEGAKRIGDDSVVKSANPAAYYNAYPIYGKMADDDFFSFFNEGFVEDKKTNTSIYSTRFRILDVKNKTLAEDNILYNIFLLAGDVTENGIYVAGIDRTEETQKILLARADLKEKKFIPLMESDNPDFVNSDVSFLRVYDEKIFLLNPNGTLLEYSLNGKLNRETKLKGDYTSSYSFNSPYLETETDFLFIGLTGDSLLVNKKTGAVTEKKIPDLKTDYSKSFHSICMEGTFLYIMNEEKTHISQYDMSKDFKKTKQTFKIDKEIQEHLQNSELDLYSFGVMD